MATVGKSFSIGIDLGGTKIEAVAMDLRSSAILARERILTPREDYGGTISAIAGLIERIATIAGEPAAIANAQRCPVGIGMPGSISPLTGLVQNANSTWLNGRAFHRDLTAALRRDIHLANDANCFALSEATDGAGQGLQTVFGVILGTGCGGGLVHRGRLIEGPRGIAGEWGHVPLPLPDEAEQPGPKCWCGRRGCIETWVSGPGLAADHANVTGKSIAVEEIVAQAKRDDAQAKATLERHASRLARGLAMVVNIFDPDAIILGGGLSNMSHLYDQLPKLMAPHIFTDDRRVTIYPPKWGDASGVRGAARLCA